MAVGFLTPQGKDLVQGARDTSFSHCTRDSVPIPWDHQNQLVRQRASSILSFTLLQTWSEMDMHSPHPTPRQNFLFPHRLCQLLAFLLLLDLENPRISDQRH